MAEARLVHGSVAPLEFPHLPESSTSLLKKYLTPEVWSQLKDRTTRGGVTLHDCIRSGLATPESVIGLYAGDADSYDVFNALFAPVIAECHAGPATRADRAGALENPDPDGAYIVSTRLRLARNLIGRALRPVATRESDLDVERQAKAAFASLSGAYHALSDVQTNHGFQRGDPFQDAAGLNRNWPDGRGVFIDAAQSFLVWVNEEDHLRFISLAPKADIAGAYARLRDGVEMAARSLAFQHSDRYGYITSCPTNLGAGLRVGFRIKLPSSGASPEFNALCRRHDLTVRSVAGERAPIAADTYDISARGRIGLSEAACLEECLAGITALLALEKSASGRP